MFLDNLVDDNVLNENGFTQEDISNDAIVLESVLTEELSPAQLKQLDNDVRDSECLQEECILTEGKKIMRVNMTKDSILNRLKGRFVLVIAKEKQDRDFFKLVRIWQIKKMLKEKLNKKYGQKAFVRAKKAYTSLMKSKSSTAREVPKKEEETN